MTHYTLVVFGKLGLFFQFRSQIILKENLFLHLVVSDPNPSLPSFPLFFSGWLVSGDYRYKQPAELGRGLCLSGRPVTMRKKNNPRHICRWAGFPDAASNRATCSSYGEGFRCEKRGWKQALCKSQGHVGGGVKLEQELRRRNVNELSELQYTIISHQILKYIYQASFMLSDSSGHRCRLSTSIVLTVSSLCKVTSIWVIWGVVV